MLLSRFYGFFNVFIYVYLLEFWLCLPPWALLSAVGRKDTTIRINKLYAIGLVKKVPFFYSWMWRCAEFKVNWLKTVSYCILTCFCEETGSEGKFWDDLLRGGGCGGASRFCGAAAWNVVVVGIRGSCIFWTEKCWVVGWIGTGACGLSGSGSTGDPANICIYGIFYVTQFLSIKDSIKLDW